MRHRTLILYYHHRDSDLSSFQPPWIFPLLIIFIRRDPTSKVPKVRRTSHLDALLYNNSSCATFVHLRNHFHWKCLLFFPSTLLSSQIWIRIPSRTVKLHWRGIFILCMVVALPYLFNVGCTSIKLWVFSSVWRFRLVLLTIGVRLTNQ